MIVVPFNRPAQLPRVLGMWRAQKSPQALVLAGKDPGLWVEVAQRAGATVTLGHTSIGAARNAGVKAAREAGSRWLYMWDDDNYYGPEYTTNLESNGTIVSQGIGFVRFASGLRLFSSRRFAPGHCTAFDPRVAAEFPEWSLAEDVEWSRRMLAQGHVIRYVSPWHSIYDRTQIGHAFEAPEAMFRRCFGPSRAIGNTPDAFVDTLSDLTRFPLEIISDEDVFSALVCDAS